MVLCPRCGSLQLLQRIVFAHPDAIVQEQAWSCRVDGCGWEGPKPDRTREVGLLARIVTGIKIRRVTKAMRDLQASGDLIIVRDGPETTEVVS